MYSVWCIFFFLEKVEEFGSFICSVLKRVKFELKYHPVHVWEHNIWYYYDPVELLGVLL